MTRSSDLAYVHFDEESRTPVYIEHFQDWTLERPGGERPHRHDFQMLLWFYAGAGWQRVDGRSLPTAPGTLTLISRGQVHAFEETQALSGYAVAFTDEFFPARAGEVPAHRTLFNYPRGDGTCAVEGQAASWGRALLELLTEEHARVEVSGDHRTLRPLVEALLERVRGLVGDPGGAAVGGLVQAFLTLLENHFCQHHDVAFYAERLNRSPDQLSRLLSGALGRGAKQIIRERVLLEARRLLGFSERPVKAISGELGFSDAFHFSKAFKAALGVSPQGYRAQIRKST